jgi:hypothetical protein
MCRRLGQQLLRGTRMKRKRCEAVAEVKESPPEPSLAGMARTPDIKSPARLRSASLTYSRSRGLDTA